MPAARRGQLEMIRDLLLAIAMAPLQQEKPTRLMYAIGTSWRTMMGRDANPEKGWEKEEGLLELVMRKELVKDVGPAQIPGSGRVYSRARKDKRTSSVYAITDKGLLVLRLMDLLWVYLEGEEPQVRVPPTILRILARATNYGESLEKLVDNVVYQPRLSVEKVDEALDPVIADMRHEDLLIKSEAPDKTKLIQAIDIVIESEIPDEKIEIEESPQIEISGGAVDSLAKAVRDMPAQFFVNSIINGVEELEEKSGPSIPKQIEASYTVLKPIVVTRSSVGDSYLCPLCSFRTFSRNYKGLMRSHFKKHHKKHTPIFEE